MKIRHRVYKVQLVEQEIEGKLTLQLLELGDKGIDVTRDIEVNEHADLELLAQQLAKDNHASEKMLCKIKKVGDTFNLTVKIIAE